MMGQMYRGVQGLAGGKPERLFLSGLGFTYESTARAELDKALALFNSYSSKIGSIKNAAAKAQWEYFLSLHKKNLDLASQYFDQDRDSDSYELSRNAISGMTAMQASFMDDVNNVSIPDQITNTQERIAELSSQVSETERQAAEDGLFSFAAYKTGETISKGAAGLVKGIVGGVASGGAWGIAGMAAVALGVLVLLKVKK